MDSSFMLCRYSLHYRLVLGLSRSATSLWNSPSRPILGGILSKPTQKDWASVSVDSNHGYKFRRRHLHFCASNNGRSEAAAIDSSQVWRVVGFPDRLHVRSPISSLLPGVALTVIHRACIASFLSLYYKIRLNEHTADSLWASMPVNITMFVGLGVHIHNIPLIHLQIYRDDCRCHRFLHALTRLHRPTSLPQLQCLRLPGLVQGQIKLHSTRSKQYDTLRHAIL